MPVVTLERGERGALAIVLHTHMPYVEGFGTWPFGEEWLWEAMAGCYLPLLDLLDAGAPLTLSLTPVLCDQLEAPGSRSASARSSGRCAATPTSEDAPGLRAGGHEDARARGRTLVGGLRAGARALRPRGGDLLGALAPYAPVDLLGHARGTAAARHRRRRARCRYRPASRLPPRALRGEDWRGGFWLPECAYAPWLNPALADAGVHATCVELTNRFGLGAREHLRPLAGEDGVTLVPIDRATMTLVWSDDGYPANGAYRDYHHHTVHHHTPVGQRRRALRPRARRSRSRRSTPRTSWPAPARACAATATGLPGGGLAVCALDTELLGHWWYEGIAWLEAVVEECARQGLELVRLDDALDRLEPRSRWRTAGWEASSWGEDGDLSTWSGPAVAETGVCDARGRASGRRRRRPDGGARGGARAARAAGERLGLHGLPRARRALRARAFRRPPRGARATRSPQGPAAGEERVCATSPRYADPAALLCP